MECYSEDELKHWGTYFSKMFNVVESNDWANLIEEKGVYGIGSRPGTLNGMYGKTHSEEAKRKMSDKALGRPCHINNRLAVSAANKIRKQSEETRSKRSRSLMGKKHSDETKSKMSLKAKGRTPWNKGIPRTNEERMKMSLANPNRKTIITPQGRFNSAEEYANIYGNITANGLRAMLRDNKPINKISIARNALYTLEDFGKTPRELGFYYETDTKALD
jgi:hypothetical protein